MSSRTKQTITRLKADLERAQYDLKRAEECSNRRLEIIGALAVFAAGLINNFDQISYRRAVDVLNELQKRA